MFFQNCLPFNLVEMNNNIALHHYFLLIFNQLENIQFFPSLSVKVTFVPVMLLLE